MNAPAPTLAKHDDNLIWIDLEMTGLDPDKDKVIEAAVIVTNADLSIMIEGPVFTLSQPQALLDGMDKWNRSTHSKSGLLERIKHEGVSEAHAAQHLLEFVKRYVPKAKSPMCGNSICQDRRFLYASPDLRRLEQYFHYRNLDISTLKELARRWAPKVVDGFKKKQQHTAMADIRESIEELRHYREQFLRLP